MNFNNFLNNLLFRKMHGSNIIYNQCWEDPRLDKACLQLKKSDTMLVLTSAGCNVLDYMLAGVKKIHAVDVNYRQNALLELKIIMIEKLDYEIFFKFFGNGRIAEPNKIYRQSIRAFLSTSSQEFWDKNIKLFDEKRRRGFYYSTTSGFFAWIANCTYRKLLNLDGLINALTRADSLEEQKKIYLQIEPYVFTKIFKFIWGLPAILNLTGVPAPQLNLINSQYPGGISQFIQDIMRHVMTKTHLKRDNYFWLVYLLGEYTHDCCPSYLKQENFHILKNMDLRKTIQLHDKSVSDFMSSYTGKIDKFVLLDHMDWLCRPAHQTILAEQWKLILKKAASNSIILFRSAGMNIDWMNQVNITHKNKTQPLFDLLNFNVDLAKQLHALDRVHTYGSFYVVENSEFAD